MQWPVDGRMSPVECWVGAAEGLTGDGHHVVLGGAVPAQHHLVLAGEEPIGGNQRGLLIQDADGAVLPDAVGHLVGVHPQGELSGQQLVQLGRAESDLAGCPADDGVHPVVNAETAVARALRWLLRKPVVFVVLCEHRTGEVPWLEQLGQGCYYHKQDDGIKARKGPSDFKQQGALS